MILSHIFCKKFTRKFIGFDDSSVSNIQTYVTPVQNSAKINYLIPTKKDAPASK